MMASEASTNARADGTARRRLPAAERRVLILDAALRTFAANGYDGAAMDEIAAAAGISKAVVYDHVASKQELYAQLLYAIRDDIERQVGDALGLFGVDEESRVQAAANAIYRYVEEHPEASRLLLLELQGTSRSAIGRELEERITDGLSQSLGADPHLFGRHADRTDHLRIFAELLKSSVLGLAHWWHRNPEVRREDLVDHTVAFVWPAIQRARSAQAPADA